MAPELQNFRRRLAVAPAAGMARALTGVVALGFYGVLASVIAAHVCASCGDFETMWKAGFLVRAGDVTTLYDRRLFDLWLQHRFGGAYADESWLYAPPMGLVAALASLAPATLSFWAWRGATLLAAAALLRGAGLGYLVIAAGLLGPAEGYDLLLGQNGALTGGLLVASLLMMRDRPTVAGVLAGCLCIKPQIAVLAPVVLLRPRYRRALLAGLATALALAAAATAVQGWRVWRLFFEVARPNAGRILAIPFGHAFQMSGVTVFLMARSLGFGLQGAWLAQGAGSLAAAVGVWWLWRRPGVDPVARMATTVCLSILAMPYGFSYDLIGFSVAIAALAPRAAPAALPVLAALWFAPALTTAVTQDAGVVLMPVAALLGAGMAALQLRLPPAALTVKAGLANPRRGFD